MTFTRTAKRIKRKSSLKRWVVTTCLVAAVGLPVIDPTTANVAAAQSHAAKPSRNAESTVQAYFQILNAGMASGDFSGLSSVYASDATLTKSGPDGKTAVYHGLTEIAGFYQGLYQKIPKWQWTTDEMRPLSKGIVLAYEHAGSPPLSVASRCVHVFMVRKGKITSYDLTAFFPGQQ